MRIGEYTDGRPVEYDEAHGSFDVGGTPVTAEQVVAYGRAGQIAWASEELERWVYEYCAHQTAAHGTPGPTAEPPKGNWLKDRLRTFFARRTFVHWVLIILGGGMVLAAVGVPWAAAYGLLPRLGLIATALALLAGGVIMCASVEVSVEKTPDQTWQEWARVIGRASLGPLWDALRFYLLVLGVAAAVVVAGALIMVLFVVLVAFGVLWLWSQSGNSSTSRTVRRTSYSPVETYAPSPQAAVNTFRTYDQTGNFTGSTVDGRHYDPLGNFTGSTVDGRHYDPLGNFTGSTVDGRHYDPVGNFTGSTVDGRHYDPQGDFTGQNVSE